MKFIKGLSCRRKLPQRRVNPIERVSSAVMKDHRVTKNRHMKEHPKWVYMRANSLVYKRALINIQSKHTTKSKSRWDNVFEDQDESKEEDKKSRIETTLKMLCPICHFLINKCTSAPCGHTFCGYCIDEYLLFKDKCPVCEARIGDDDLRNSPTIDSAVEVTQKLSNFSDDEFHWRRQRVKDLYFERKKIDKSIFKNFDRSDNIIRIDARDADGIWCKAVVKGFLYTKDKWITIVHFIGWDKAFDNAIPIDSPRLAKEGFYTSRSILPHYENNDNPYKKSVLNLPENEDFINVIRVYKNECLKEKDPLKTSNETSDQFQKECKAHEHMLYRLQRCTDIHRRRTRYNGRIYSMNYRIPVMNSYSNSHTRESYTQSFSSESESSQSGS
ncbi:unnamed protein product [Moneuplotes crassus]|uniref:RING-type domain-containing protein n=1 Tax=Euplotes crassus TaxID=5936 RepID=A0AAD1ULV0_EUPCR|nr:unnamed protein product [Moneuplotes crassus]